MLAVSKHGVKKFTLLVEPDADDAFLIRWAFQKLGIFHPIYAVQTGAEALEYLLGTGKFQRRAA